MSLESPRQASAAEAHTGEEVEQAIRALTPGDFKKLRAAAYALVHGLGLETAGRDHEDLYSEAFSRTLAGARSWRRGVDFRHHLGQTMRSIAWTWHRYEERRESAGWVAAPAPPDDPEGARGVEDPMDPASLAPGVENTLYTAGEIGRFLRKFQHDRTASVVLHRWGLGDSMAEMALSTGIGAQDLQWAARRIRRFAQKSGTDGGRAGGRHDRGEQDGQ